MTTAFQPAARATGTPYASVAFCVPALRSALYHSIARRLKEQYGSRVHAYVTNAEEARGLRRVDREGLWDSVSSTNVFARSVGDGGHDPDHVVERARALENFVGETMGRVALGHRQLGRGYSPGGFRYPRSPNLERMGRFEMLHGMCEVLDFWRAELKERQITLVVDGTKDVVLVCRALGVPYRRLIGSRYQNYWFWTPDEYQSSPALEPTYRALAAWSEAELERGYAYSRVRNENSARRRTLVSCLRRAARLLAQHAWWRARGYERTGNFRLSDLVALPFQERARYAEARRLARTRLDDLEPGSFAYFPMHKEPEVSFLVRSPDFTHQHAAIMALSRDLPADMVLAVKENVLSVAQRPRDFYAQLRELRNVVLLDLATDSIAAVRKCAFVATMTGTAGLEAALLGRPVLTFSRHAPYAFLDHVRVVAGTDDLRPAIDWATSDSIDADAARSSGARLLEALKQSSFDMLDYGTSVEDLEFRRVSEEIVDIACDGLYRSLDGSSQQATVIQHVG